MQVKATRIGKNNRAPDWGGAVVSEIMAASKADTAIKAEPMRIVRNWENKPTFKVQVTLNAIYKGAITVGYIVGGTELARNIWGWLDKGTRRHPIRARNAPTLVFRWGGPGSYKPKTKPGGSALSFGGPGAVSGGVTHRPIEVDHPGTEPREFYVYLGSALLPGWVRTVQQAIVRGMRNANAGKKYAISEHSKVIMS